MTNYLKKTLAFTLAETLIVMGIIGVVSALTLPNLNSATGEKEKVAKVRKIYRDLDDAVGRAQVVYGPFESWNIGMYDATRFAERITEFMKVSKTCGLASGKGCFSTKDLYYVNGTKVQETTFDKHTAFYKIVLADGTSVVFIPSDFIWIDIDGPNKGNNTYGKDLFRFEIENRTVIPSRKNNVSEYMSDTSGLYSSGWIIDYDNMDYLKCRSSLNENKTSCK